MPTPLLALPPVPSTRQQPKYDNPNETNAPTNSNGNGKIKNFIFFGCSVCNSKYLYIYSFCNGNNNTANEAAVAAMMTTARDVLFLFFSILLLLCAARPPHFSIFFFLSIRNFLAYVFSGNSNGARTYLIWKI